MEFSQLWNTNQMHLNNTTRICKIEKTDAPWPLLVEWPAMELSLEAMATIRSSRRAAGHAVVRGAPPGDSMERGGASSILCYSSRPPADL